MIGKDRKRLDGTGNDGTRRDGTGCDGYKGNRTGRNGKGQDGSVRGCSQWVEFNSSVGFSIVFCMYAKLYYLLVTDISEKCIAL